MQRVGRYSPRYWPLPSRKGGPTGPLCMGCTYCTGAYPAAAPAPPPVAARGPHPSTSRSSRGGRTDEGVGAHRMASASELQGEPRGTIKPAPGWFGTRPRDSPNAQKLDTIHKQFPKSRSLHELSPKPP